MRKLLIYGALLVAALLVPTQTTALGKLKPVETVGIYQEDGEFVIETDTKDIGRGMSVSEAIRNLEETTSGTIYLDTADYLLVMDGGEPFVQYVAGYLKDSVRICRASKDVKIEEAASYLSVHTPNVELKEYQSGTALQMLRRDQERLFLEEK